MYIDAQAFSSRKGTPPRFRHPVILPLRGAEKDKMSKHPSPLLTPAVPGTGMCVQESELLKQKRMPFQGPLSEIEKLSPWPAPTERPAAF